MLQELIEPLFNSLQQLFNFLLLRTQGHAPEHAEDYSQVQPQPQDHTHAGTIEISRSDSPPNLRSTPPDPNMLVTNIKNKFGQN